jgi:hypothetical protein
MTGWYRARNLLQTTSIVVEITGLKTVNGLCDNKK